MEILSTGGSAEKLRQAGIKVIEVGDYTGFPEMMDGRVKTLHPRIHGGILQRRDLKTHQDEAQKHAIPPIDLVVVNLYPFRETVAKGADFETCIENIDIGGPAMVRSAAKNHDFVAIVTDPAQYDELIAEMKTHSGGTSLDFRKKLAAAAYAHTAGYDAVISRWFAGATGRGISGHGDLRSAETAGPALWRKPPSKRGLLCHGFQPPRYRQRDTNSGQGIELQ